jgi:DNA-binding MarR family transcriptional regulator
MPAAIVVDGVRRGGVHAHEHLVVGGGALGQVLAQGGRRGWAVNGNGSQEPPMTPATKPASTTSILDQHRSSPGLLLALLGHEAMRRLRAAHTAHGLKPRQFQILGLLHDHGGLAQRELMEVMGIDPGILVTLLNPLEAEGLVTRDRDPDDRRRHLVTLTRVGEKKLVAASRAQKETEDELFVSLTGDQREQLRTLLVDLRDALGTDPERVGDREVRR